MVWFQCEDCGDNLKKPKLANHFRVCSAYKLSCIDCGQVFGQETVQAHTQCITETEKYGPKGQNKASNGTPAKPNSASKQKPDIDIYVGLSERPPWFCSLCNTSATSKQTLLSHAEGKKHRGKARGYHAAQQPPKQTEESTPNADDSTGNEQKETEKVQEPETDSVPLSKKRKHEACKNNGVTHAGVDASSGELGSGEVIQIANAEAEEIKRDEKKAKSTKEDTQTENSSPKEDGLKKAKWKKMITSALKSNGDGSLKMKKLQKYVLKALRESGSTAEEKNIFEKLEHKIVSSSKFTINGKYVQLVTKR